MAKTFQKYPNLVTLVATEYFFSHKTGWKQKTRRATEEGERAARWTPAAARKSREGEELTGHDPSQAQGQPEEGGEPHVGAGGLESEVWQGNP